MKRVIVYFDGFNFYNGLKDKSAIEGHWKNYYWIDLVKFAGQFLTPNVHELVAVKYFTAPPGGDGERSRQSALFNANILLNPGKFFVFNGQYQNKEVVCKLCKRKS